MIFHLLVELMEKVGKGAALGGKSLGQEEETGFAWVLTPAPRWLCGIGDRCLLCEV